MITLTKEHFTKLMRTHVIEDCPNIFTLSELTTSAEILICTKTITGYYAVINAPTARGAVDISNAQEVYDWLSDPEVMKHDNNKQTLDWLNSL